MFIKVLLTIIFLVVMVGVGIYSRKQARSVDGFVLGGRAVGPWLTAFAFGTSYFSAVVFVGYRTVRMEVRSFQCMDWYWQCHYRFTLGMDNPGSSY